MIYLLMNLILTQAIASDDWLCHGDNVSSVKRGNSLYVCGASSAHTEEIAKEHALLNAENNFHDVCNISNDCRNHKVTVEAKRTSCDPLAPEGSGYGSAYLKFKCFRLVVFTIED